ncbi:MAG TPA: response regulator [Bryobacteraceae bacterium]|jgi:CheY-like chemotaxis protein|nr:response regulator [Bryobacteraceae bacterium]
MSVILLADDSPHAQRMGQRILAEEGHRVECVSDGQAAALRLSAADPDVVIADAHLPGISGIELCRYMKSNCRHVRVILTAGSLEALDEAAAKRAGCDAILRKPFEASVMAETLAPLLEAAQRDRQSMAAATAVAPSLAAQPPDDIRAAVERAVERELPRLLDELTQRVLLALGH